MSSPCGQSHTSFISSSCPQVQIVVELLPSMRVIKVNMPLRGGHALKRILPPKKKKIGEKPKLHGVTQDTAVKRTGLS